MPVRGLGTRRPLPACSMSSRQIADAQSALIRGWILSLLLHVLVLLVPQHAPEVESRPGTLQARLVPPVEKVAAPSDTKESAKQSKRARQVLAMPENPAKRRSISPAWTAAEKKEMNRFLEELGSAQKRAPTLAQRSLAMAHEMARQDARQEEAEMAVIERLPNSPPLDPLGLELYLEALIRKLNRSASHVRNDPRAQGVKVAAVLVRLNPNGSLKNFKVINAGDQQDEIAFVRQVVEQAVPFAAFPADMQRSAKSLSMMICIMPPKAGGSGFGFTRQADGRGC